MGAVATVLPAFPRIWALPEHEKHSFASATTFAHSVGDFSLNTLHSQMRWLPLHTRQRGVGGVVDVEACF